MIRLATPDDAPLLAHLHDLARQDWPDFSHENPDGVRTAISDDGMRYLLLKDQATVCLHADTKNAYGYMDFPYTLDPEAAQTLVSMALTELKGLRVECPLPVQRGWEAALLKVNGFTPVRTQRRMVLNEFPALADLPVPEGFQLLCPEAEAIERLHNVVFPKFSLLAGWRDDPGNFPGIGLSHHGELVGYVLTAQHGGFHWLSELAVHPDFRQMGLGRNLTLHGLKQMQDAGASQVHLYVNEHHAQHAPQLYESVGFRTHRHLVRYSRENS